MIAATGQSLRHHIVEQLPAARRRREGVARQAPRQMSANLVRWRGQLARKCPMPADRSPIPTPFGRHLDRGFSMGDRLIHSQFRAIDLP